MAQPDVPTGTWLPYVAVGAATITLVWSANSLFKEIFKPVENRRSSWNRHQKKALAHTVEIMVTDIESAHQAVKGGANSLELCANRVEGGTTPSIGFIEEVVNICRTTSIEVNVLIRPRPGDFVYSPAEFELIQKDIFAAKLAGADGIVVGIMTEEGQIDVPRMSIVREITRDMKLTFHRAFDLCVDYRRAVEDIARIGCDRLLTSGQEKFAYQASATKKLKKIVELANNRFHVVAGAGVTPDNVQEIIRQSQVPGIHCSNGVNKTVLTSLNIDQTLETPLFTMAAEMKVWKGVKETLVNTLAERSWEVWIEQEYEREKKSAKN